ncbi:hypothetical protein PPL_10032 [Heterostelium album PN500]|uniref:Uncharacterized protein n=1 Tax=Heterostelium pallidum (strain ATCC 26659 / Pp 5 / PN500) TaxID=670386 RepID=D3BQ51_HETP5|nr:hypothetical protein PPL_10032 [Heterostelium album PN500]EFA76271.1 hypothetical protein PPL_10032 [Heterostelium album PN500]|eukprot:XP_020428403.1 hypothetical protein PPL_10032 [Heterostelium album PN500]
MRSESLNYDQSLIYYSNNNRDHMQTRATEKNNSYSIMANTPCGFTECPASDRHVIFRWTEVTKLWWPTIRNSVRSQNQSYPTVIFVDENGHDKPPPEGKITIKTSENGNIKLIIEPIDKNNDNSQATTTTTKNIQFNFNILFVLFVLLLYS